MIQPDAWSCQRFGRRDAQEKCAGDQRPALNVGHEDPAHALVVRARAFLLERRSARCILEQRKRIQVKQQLPRHGQGGPGLPREKSFHISILHAR